MLDGDVRKKDGVELSVSYFTSINSVRQKTQAVNKKNWEDAGIKVQLGQVTADVFFSSAPGNDQTFYHNYRDIDMFTDNPTSTIPLGYMLSYYAGAGQQQRLAEVEPVDRWKSGALRQPGLRRALRSGRRLDRCRRGGRAVSSR